MLKLTKEQINALKTFCVTPVSAYKSKGEVKLCSTVTEWNSKTNKHEETKDRFYSFIDNSSNVLGIAHLDSVQYPDFYGAIEGPEQRIYSPVLDDRLGVFTLMWMLPSLGINVDILLTTGEESGCSTAEEFTTTKKYNWMFQFDRAGDDVVMYQYDTLIRRELLKEYGFRPGHGTCSDIKYLSHLGCTGFNFGCGYYDYHTQWAYFDVSKYLEQINKFVVFFDQMKDTFLEYKEEPITPYQDYDYGYYASGSGQGNLFDDCGTYLFLYLDTYIYSPGSNLWRCVKAKDTIDITEEFMDVEEKDPRYIWMHDGVICPVCQTKNEFGDTTLCKKCHNSLMLYDVM